MKIKRNPIQSELDVRRGGGCVGAIGMVFAVWAGLLGGALFLGWRAGDIPSEAVLAGGILIGLFVLGGLGVGTYRERFRFDGDRGALTRTRRVLFVTYLRRQWSFHELEKVELGWHCRSVNNRNRWFHVVRLVPKGGAEPAGPLELGSGEAGQQMRTLAQEIADFCNLPLHEPPKDENW